MVQLFSLVAIFGLVAAVPLFLVWSVVKLTKREHLTNRMPQLVMRSTLKVGVLCFLAYAALFVGLALLSVGGHMAHADFYGSRPVSLDPSLVVVDRILFALGLPIPSLVNVFATKASVPLSAFHLLLLYIANGIFLSSLVTLAYSWLRQMKRRHDAHTAA